MGDCQTYSGEEWKKVRRKKDELRIMKEGTSRTVIGEQGFVSDPACVEATSKVLTYSLPLISRSGSPIL
jgi:hypothetical protein